LLALMLPPWLPADGGTRALQIAAAVLTSAALLGCGSSPETRPGNPSEYRRIEALTDCAALRAELNQARANYQRELNAGPDREAYRTITRSYLNTVETRMKRSECK
jgi:hypothetical protein